MEFKNILENIPKDEDNLSLIKDLNKIDNILKNSFHNHYYNSSKQDKKIINKIKLYFYNYEYEEDLHQKQINKLVSFFGNKDKNLIPKSQFKPLLGPKKISLKGRVFTNNNIICNKNNKEKTNI